MKNVYVFLSYPSDCVFNKLTANAQASSLFKKTIVIIMACALVGTLPAQTLELIKEAYEPSGLERAEPNGDGTYTLHYRGAIRNLGGTNFTNVSVIDNLSTAAGGTFGTYNATATVSGDLSPGEYFVPGAFGGDRVDATNGDLDENPNFDGDTNTDLFLPTSELDAGQSSFYFLYVIVYPGFDNQGIYVNSATASADEGGTTVTDVSWDGLFNQSDPDGDGDPTNDNDPAVLVVCMPNGGCGPGQTSLGFDDSGWNGGSGWNDNSTSPQTWNDFDGMGNNITATLSGNNPSGGTPGPNVYTGNPFGCLNALRLTGSTSSTSLAQFPTETISFDDGIPFNQFFVGGMEAGRDDIDERAEISVVTFSNDGTELDPSTFTYTELTPSDVAYAFVGNSIYVVGNYT